MLKQLQYGTLALLLALTLVLLNLPPLAAGRLKSGVSALFLPLFGLAGSAQSFIDRVSYATWTRSTLIAELERLRLENQQLQVAQAQSHQVLEENTRLRNLLGWQSKRPWKLRAARVIGREPSAWWRSVALDYGTRDGAQVGQPVMTPQGLVGRIREVTPLQSRVALIGDPECGVSAVIQETRDQGILQDTHSGSVGSEWLILKTLQHSPGILAGHNVVTSGLGGIFPAGIPVGQIIDTRSAEGGLYTEARVRLAANLNRLEEVWIITSITP